MHKSWYNTEFFRHERECRALKQMVGAQNWKIWVDILVAAMTMITQFEYGQIKCLLEKSKPLKRIIVKSRQWIKYNAWLEITRMQLITDMCDFINISYASEIKEKECEQNEMYIDPPKNAINRNFPEIIKIFPLASSESK